MLFPLWWVFCVWMLNLNPILGCHLSIRYIWPLHHCILLDRWSAAVEWWGRWTVLPLSHMRTLESDMPCFLGPVKWLKKVKTQSIFQNSPQWQGKRGVGRTCQGAVSAQSVLKRMIGIFKLSPNYHNYVFEANPQCDGKFQGRIHPPPFLLHVHYPNQRWSVVCVCIGVNFPNVRTGIS